MKKFLFHVALVIGSLVAIFFVLVAAVFLIADNEDQRERLAYQLGFTFGVFLVLLVAAILIFAAYKFLMYAIFGNKTEKPPIDKDAPLDRYLK